MSEPKIPVTIDEFNRLLSKGAVTLVRNLPHDWRDDVRKLLVRKLLHDWRDDVGKLHVPEVWDANWTGVLANADCPRSTTGYSWFPPVVGSGVKVG